MGTNHSICHLQKIITNKTYWVFFFFILSIWNNVAFNRKKKWITQLCSFLTRKPHRQKLLFETSKKSLDTNEKKKKTLEVSVNIIHVNHAIGKGPPQLGGQWISGFYIFLKIIIKIDQSFWAPCMRIQKVVLAN